MNAIEILSNLEEALEVTRKNGCETFLPADDCKQMHDAIRKKKFTRSQLLKLDYLLEEMNEKSSEEATKNKKAISSVNKFMDDGKNLRTFLISKQEWTDDAQKKYEEEREKLYQEVERYTLSYCNNVVNGVNIAKLRAVVWEEPLYEELPEFKKNMANGD